MDITEIVSIVGAAGAFGGIVNCMITGEFNQPQFDRGKKIWRPGWIGNVLIGAVAALVVWAMYGPLASYDLVVPDNSKPLTLTLSQLFVSVVIGLGGGNILTELSQKAASRVTMQNLLGAVEVAASTSTSPDN